MIYIYEIDKLNLTLWHKLDDMKDPWRDIGKFVKAAIEIKKVVPRLKDWDGDGEYWLAPLPMPKSYIVVVRPNCNPYESGFIVSPIDLPIEGTRYLSIE